MWWRREKSKAWNKGGNVWTASSDAETRVLQSRYWPAVGSKREHSRLLALLLEI